MKRLFFVFLILFLPYTANATQGLNYETYIGGGGSPSLNNLTLITTGTVSTVNYNWGGGQVLDSGRADGIIVHFTGYYKVDTTGIYQFGITGDDGIKLIINSQTVIDYWGDQGPTFRSGSVSLTAGTVVPIEIWYYENGGGAVVQFYWYNGSWQIVPSTNLATVSTEWQPALCCGGSSTSFGMSLQNAAKVNNYISRTTGDNQVYIEQIGNSNTVTVQQTDNPNNYVNYRGTGNNNTVSITQSGANAQANYTELGINGNSNNVNITQSSTGSVKSAFVSVNDNNNIISVQQKDSGSHYLNLAVSGGNKTVSVLQQGSAGHMANVTLGGTQIGLNLTQSGATQQFYSINHTCATVGGCGTITVQQGQ